jgi:anti-anti-sigma factor
MQRRHRRVQADGSADVDEVPRGNSDTARRLMQVPLAPARLNPDCGHLRSVEAAVADGDQLVAARQLVVRWERGRSALIIWLGGALDRATATMLDRELDARALGRKRLVVDLTGLQFIDSSGLYALVRIHRRVTERGDRLSFRHGKHIARRPRRTVTSS